MKEIDTLSHLLIFFQDIQLFIFWKKIKKGDALEKFQYFLKEVENQFSRKKK